MSPLGPEEFSAELAEWLARADGRISVDPHRWPGAFVSLEGGERVFLFDRDVEGWITVSSSSRGSEPVPRFRTPSLDVVERFLAHEAGPAARFLAGVPGEVRVPFRVDELPAGAELHPLSDGELGGFEVLTVDGVVVGEFGFAPRGPLAHASAVRASRFATASLAAIAESHLSPDGAPLFTLR